MSVEPYDDDPDQGYAPARGSGERVPPADVAAERAVLGAMLISRDAIAEVVETMRAADHYLPVHETIHDAILDMFGRGEPVDMLTLGAELQRAGDLNRVGGAMYLHTLANEVPLAANALHYATTVRDKAVLRRLAEAATRIAQWAYAQEGSVDDVVDRAQAEVMDAVPARSSDDYRPIADTLDETIDEIEALGSHDGSAHGVPTGFADLDDLTNGLHPGQMVVVAARPAVGKSTLALDICRSASLRHGMTSVFFSLEMTRHEITTRTISAEAKISLQKLRSGGLNDDDWRRMAGVMGQVSQAPFFIDDSPNLTMTEIRAKARRLKQRHDLRLIVIDYMQLMMSGKRVENRQVEVSEFSRQIKLLAKELEVPVVALSQLNRGPEQRTDKRPMMSDLRESGSIEQDADIVILLHREDLYAAESTRPGEADLIVAKHRNGPTRDVTVAFQGHYSRFVDMATF